MKCERGLVVVCVTSILALGLCRSGFAFHEGGVGACDGCHTMHNFPGGSQTSTFLPQFQAGPNLIKGSDQSSICLNCHQQSGNPGPSGYHISTSLVNMPAGVPPLQRTPGGDFGWLLKDYNWVPQAGATPLSSPGERHGHNIVAVDFGYVADTMNSVAPGGTYPASSLACTSCHDPHGKYRISTNPVTSSTNTGLPIYTSGSYGDLPAGPLATGTYRLLGGTGYQPKSLPGNLAFANDAPIAVAPRTYNQSEAVNQVKVAYGKGMSEWCSNCHTSMLLNSYVSGTGHPGHPAGNSALLSMQGQAAAGNSTLTTIGAIYDAYVKTGDLTGIPDTSYLSLVPFEYGSNDLAFLATLSGNGFPAYPGWNGSSTANVSCLSCHRAHASGWDRILRFSVNSGGVTVADLNGNPVYPDPVLNPALAMGRTIAETQAAYYDRPPTRWAPFQGVLCNKCHGQN